ncbi:uncharacterized protein F5891DRAFT_998991 [Suillus fuscotomentosus]|uniref:Uncharacterized protein n=1 Tax=Suillus fuscotomentosus TaxID=1912939 RepID=A0AAD4EIS1_9AGAM|nr:uncharacterized protein F5891DRAFT_998991 [Suillus fuscotomentosus]KAG1906841.1 hypothetical protein F5891DRAFT_998991 [Suillus fuscotomentosus]
MLSASVTTTPRPRPPGRVRRISTHVKTSPPPPYAATSLLDDPLDNSSDLKRKSFNGASAIAAWDDIPTNHPQNWNGRSREELSELLLKADELIKDRENELSFTTAVCKSLYENNLELQNKHKTLLARLPTSSASVSPSGSSASSPTTPGTPLPHSPHYYTNTSSSHANTSVSRSRRSQRRVSVSPADLALLSDQNAELLAKLEKLESESVQTDQAGRRKLRCLEKEIQGLREELETTRARSDELENKAKLVSPSLESEEASKRRHEREVRVRALRGRSESDANDGEVRDFAPGGALASQGVSKRSTALGRSEKRKRPSQCLRRHASEAIFRSAPTDSKLSRKMSLYNGSSRSFPQLQSPLPTQFPVPATPEYALVSQLLQKIRELEHINSQITVQQEKTTASLQSVQRDAASIQLLYESLSDVDVIDWLAEDDSFENPGVHEENEHDEEDETIRFASLRRSMLADSSVDFDSGIEPDKQSSMRHAILPELFPLPAHHRTRRSVVGLFDSPTVSDVSDAPSVQSLIIPGLSAVPFVPQPITEPVTPEELDLPAPLAAVLPTTDFTAPQTLDNELGLAWDNCHENDHFRTPSLIDLTSLSPLSAGNAVGVPDSGTLSPKDKLSFPPSSSYISTPSTSSTSFAEQVSLKIDGVHDLEPLTYSPPNAHVETLADKKCRKSHTIRMRTNHWTEGRFEATLLSAPQRGSSADLARPPTPVPQRLVNEFVDSISRHRTHSLSRGLTGDEPRTASASPASLRQRLQKPQKRRFVSFVLELWLWFQFAIVVVIFLWAMAKRGPKSVLEEAQRRKIQ